MTLSYNKNPLNNQNENVRNNENSVENQSEHINPIENRIGNRNNCVIVEVPSEIQLYNFDKHKERSKGKKLKGFLKQFLKLRVYITGIISGTILLSGVFLIGQITNFFRKEKRFTSNSTNQKMVVEDLKKNPYNMMLYACLIGPIFEEFLFRRLLFHYINKFNKVLAYIVSIFLFAYAHFQMNPFLFMEEIGETPSYFYSGFVLAAAYDYDGYIAASILCHIFNNTISTICILYYNKS